MNILECQVLFPAPHLLLFGPLINTESKYQSAMYDMIRESLAETNTPPNSFSNRHEGLKSPRLFKKNVLVAFGDDFQLNLLTVSDLRYRS